MPANAGIHALLAFPGKDVDGRHSPAMTGVCVPGAARDRSKLCPWNGPGPAAHRFALHRVRDTQIGACHDRDAGHLAYGGTVLA